MPDLLPLSYRNIEYFPSNPYEIYNIIQDLRIDQKVESFSRDYVR